MKLPNTGNKAFDYNFNQICKEIDALQKAVNPPQVGSTQGKKLDTGNVRFIKGLDGSGYLEVGGDDGVYTTFQGGLQLKGEELPYAYLKKLSVDNFYAKNIFAQSMRTTNGNVILSDSGIVAGIISNNKFTVKNPDGTLLNPFRVGDLLYTAKFGNDHSITIKELRLVVAAISGLTVTYTKSAESGTGIPAQTGNLESGDTIVRLGNNDLSTNPDRGSVMILVTSDIRDMGTGLKNYAPYIKMLSSIDSYGDYFNGLPIVQLGNLGIISDTDFGTGAFLSPSTGTIGLYTTAGFFKGKLSLSDEDLLGDIAIGKTYKSATDPNVLPTVIREGDLWIDSSAANRFRTQVWTGNPSNDVSPGAWQNYLPGIWDAPSGSGLQITSNYMGYYDAGSFKTYIRDNGYFEFKGDANNYVSWLGTTLDIKGNITVTNPEDFTEQNPATYVQTTDPKLTNTIYEGNFWYDSTPAVKKWYKWVGLPSNATPTPGTWVEQLWGTYITGSGIYTGTVTAGQITAGTFVGFDFLTDVVGQSRLQINGEDDNIFFFVGADIYATGQVGSYGSYGAGGNYGVSIAPNLYVTTDVYIAGVTAANKALTYTTLASNTGTVGATAITSAESSGLAISATHASGHLGLSAVHELNLYSDNAITITSDGTLSLSADTLTINGTNISSFLTSESDPVYTASSWYSTTNNASNWDDAYGWVNLWGGNAFNWDAAYGWGNHASAGYLTSSTEGWRTTDVTGLGNGLGITTGTIAVKASGGLGFSGGDLVIDYTGAQSASSTTKGFVTAADWSLFNGKATISVGLTDSYYLSDIDYNVETISITINGTPYTFVTGILR